jgi:hypothetical protein
MNGGFPPGRDSLDRGEEWLLQGINPVSLAIEPSAR